MTDEELQAIIEENKDSEVIKKLTAKPSFKDFTNDPLYQKDLKSYTDSKESKAVEAFKTGKFQEAVDKRVSEIEASKGKKTAADIKAEELERKIQKLEADNLEKEKIAARSENKNKATEFLTEKGLPVKLAKFVVDEAEDLTIEKVEEMALIIEEHSLDLKKKGVTTNNTKVPKTGKSSGSGVIPEPGPEASKAEWSAYWRKMDAKKK